VCLFDRFLIVAFSVSLVLGGCSEYQAFDTAVHLRDVYAERLGQEWTEGVVVPFELDDQIVGFLDERLRPATNERNRVEQVLDHIFRRVHLRYTPMPTRSATETYRAREGNCLSFVNLFVGVARHLRLNPFYVEVRDYQRWDYQNGVVVSRGHIVAGLYVDGKLETYDFLPYRPKTYRDFKPINDLTAAAHYYNNLGAEALMAGLLQRATELLRIAAGLAPGFDKAFNNLGVALARMGDFEGALAAYSQGLEADPENIPILTNLMGLYQRLGRQEEAEDLLAKLGHVENANPFFFVYRGELALAKGDLTGALDFMRQALRRDSEIPEVHLGLVKVLLAMGEVDRARHHVERAMKLDATHPETRRYAAMIEEKTAW
jgi:Flp pilus assembly protein TadD